MTESRVNVAHRLTQTAVSTPNGVGVVVPRPLRDRAGRRQYEHMSFRELDDDSNCLAAGLLDMGMRPGDRVILMVRPGIDFISLVFAMFKAGLVTVLIDPGMGRSSLLRCLEEVQPDGFIAIPLAHAVRCLLRSRFPKARHNVTVGRKWFWGGPTIAQFRARGHSSFSGVATRAQDSAAIIFTTGSTGPPKGVLYSHGNFDRQVDELRDQYGVQPGELDLPGFPLFALFNAAMGVTTVIPDMDFTRPANASPRNILDPIHDWQITQAFGSPALWNTVGRHCEKTGEKMPSLRRVLSAGAPVPPHVLRRIKAAIHPDGDIHTPYGATEALPVATISATEVLGDTAAKSSLGAGTCVGRRFPGIEWKVIRIRDEPIASRADWEELHVGQIGELVVRGPVVTRQYITRTDANALHKVADGDTFWHRMGDVGYLDEHERFWFCGRKSHRVPTAFGTMYTIPCEAIFNQHPDIYRSALVGIGSGESKRPVMVVEPWPEKMPRAEAERNQLIQQLQERAVQNPGTIPIRDFLIHPAMPVDIRHNAKIFREKLVDWAAKRVSNGQ